MKPRQNIRIAALSPILVMIPDTRILKRWVGTALRMHCGRAIKVARHVARQANSYTNHIDIGAIVQQMLIAFSH